MAKITLSNFKDEMIKKAQKKGGVWENFGQKELYTLKEQLREKGKYDPHWNQWSSKEHKSVGLELISLNNWCVRFDLSQLKG